MHDQDPRLPAAEQAIPEYRSTSQVSSAPLETSTLRAPDHKLHWKSFAGYALLALTLSALIGLALSEFHEEIAEPFLTGLDRTLMQSLHLEANPALTRLMFTLTWIGSPIVLLPAVPLLAGLLWWRNLKRDAILLTLAVAGGGALDSALKLRFRRVRPDVPWAYIHEHSFSFPSGHSVLAVVLYGILLYLFLGHLRHFAQRLLATTAAVFLIFGIGLSRIYLGVHFPSDVVAGYFVGCIWLAGIIAADWHRNRTLRRQQTASTLASHPA